MKIILHLDMNSYFASVEQQANPFYRGKPLGVCAYLSPRGCIIASSIEAKKIGITTGMRVAEAKRLCPKIILVENEPAKYRSVTSNIFSILRQYSDRVEPYSIDEAFVDLSGYIKDFEQAHQLARIIASRIREEVGDWLKCSIGISFTRWLSKLASDITPKNSILILDQKNFKSIYEKIRLTEAWGIGKRMESRLNNLGIYTLNELKKYPPANLLRVMGKMGYYLWANVNGIEIEKVRPQEEILPKSIGHSYSLPIKTKDENQLKKILMKLAEKSGRRLRSLGMQGFSVGVGLSYPSGGGYFKSKNLKCGIFSSNDIFKKICELFKNAPLKEKISIVGVNISKMAPFYPQTSLFGESDHQNCLCRALDKINDRFGEYTIVYGEMWGTRDNAKDRIGFRKTGNFLMHGNAKN